MSQSQDIQSATTAIQLDNNHIHHQPDAKSRRYDRQLRLWAATGQSALESSRILLLSASATSTSVLKNLVLPGIGHFTILDPEAVSPADAGNNFFLDGKSSIGKSRAGEAVRLLGELNDGVEGVADTRSVEDILMNTPEWLAGFTLVIAHNLDPVLLGKLSDLLWRDDSLPPLIAVRSAGFIAEFFIQFHDHTIIESHSETAPSLRIDRPFPALREHALSLDFDGMDVTEHSHIPYVVILVRVLEEWKHAHGGNGPKSYAEKQEFKKSILAMKKKQDEENFDEAEAQAYRCWSETAVPSSISSLLSSPSLSSLSPTSPPFFHLLSALNHYTSSVPPYTLPLSATLSDMKASTEAYVHLQNMYKARAKEEKAEFWRVLQGVQGGQGVGVDEEMVDTFVKNSHGLVVLRGRQWGVFDQDRTALVTALQTAPKETATHLALSALSRLGPSPANITAEALRKEVRKMVGDEVELPEALDDAVGEIARAPTADIPNVAAFLGGLVAQEAIKLITKQYVPVNGYCVVDLVETWTGVVGAEC